MKYETLGDRMKGAYENKYRLYLPERIPVIIRLDGKAFHTFCRGLKKPFDDLFISVMQDTMLDLCKNISGCKLGYVQSDEISLLLVQTKEESQPWFDNNIQKIVSVSASMATLYFNKNFEKRVFELMENYAKDKNDYTEEELKYVDKLDSKIYTAMFDSRVFVLPKEEVNNYFIWRQQDATRNSIQSVGQANFSQKELNGKSCNDIQDMLMTQKSINWNDYATTLKRGSCCIKIDDGITKYDEVGNICDYIPRSKWVIDNEIPIFTQDRNYVEKLI